MATLLQGTFCALVLILGTAACLAEETDSPKIEEEQLFLKGGRQFSGTSLGFQDGNIRWTFSDGIEMLVPLASIERLEYPRPDFKEDPDGAIDAERFDTPADTPEQDPGYWKKFGDSCYQALHSVARSTKRIEFGARFLNGNSDTDFLDLGGRFEKNAGNWVSQLEFEGQYVQKDGETSANRWTADYTMDYDSGDDGRWILFVTNKNEYDEFENLDYRGTYSGGIGYRFNGTMGRRLVLRVGPAATVEVFRDPDNTRTTPDAFGETELIWPVTDWLIYEARSNIRSSLADQEIFRVVSNHGLIMQLDDKGRWSLKLGMRYEYNSKPNPNRLKADYTSSVLVVYTRKD